ncbi:MAG TPA: Xaa-Pro peptidase family protein, partial [Actinomycetota bacterium]|jgi:Xaa-Pro aminopeptidase|nr:Xaa-Pro peptidase family protein [Actinomycetota bacterium]
MMPGVDHAARRERVVGRLTELEAEAILVTRIPNVRYLSGFTGSNGQLLLTQSDGVFLTDSRYVEQARREAPDLRRAAYQGELAAIFAELARDAGVERVAFEAAGVTYRTYRKLAEVDVELVPTTDEVERLRWVKDPEELALIEAAQRITDEAFARIVAKLTEGRTEGEVAFDLEHSMRELGADAVAFDPIVAFGEQAAEPHHRPTDRPLRRGDVVKMDFGCTVDGYSSDMTRTVAFGDPATKLRDLHELVRRAQAAGTAALRPGMRGGEVDEAARAVIRDAGFGERFGHSLGHGIGLEVHEGPGLRHGSEDVLPEGTVVTVEPGVYVPELGGVRIEDMVVVTATGGRLLPASPRELLVV